MTNNKSLIGCRVAIAALLSMVLSSSAFSQITSSSIFDRQDRYSHQLAFDGKSNTRWASAGINNKPQWIQIDLGRVVSVTNISIHWEVAAAKEYKIEMSDDAKSWKTICHVADGKAEKRVLPGLDGKGRYLRVLCIKPHSHRHVSIWEIGLSGDAQLALNELRQKAEEERLKKLQAKQAVVREKMKQFSKHGVKDVIFAVRSDSNDGHWYANLGYWSYDENKMLYGKGGRLCKLNLESGEMTVLINDPEGTIRDPVVHYDAEKILFSWRKTDSRVFHLYECDIDGKNITQLTDGIYDDIEPCYLPDGGIIFCSGRGKRWVNCWLTQVAILYRCDADGKNIRQISANIEHDNTPWVLPDGRILYQRWEYIDRSQVNYHHFWTTNPDGTGQMVYFGNMHPGGLYIDPKPIPGTDKVLFINSPGHGGMEHRGKVAIVTDKYGPDDRSALKNISNERNYRDPWPLSEDMFLVAQENQLVVMDSSGVAASIYRLPEEFGRVVLHEPRPVIKREKEHVIPSRVDLKKKTGTLILNDVYLGRNMKGVERGDIKKLLVLESLPKPVNFTGGMDPLSYGGTFTLERILGTVPVEPDGSAYMKLPANRSLFFVALDKDNNSVKRMQSFLSVMPGETTSCIGCHEERGKTPINNAKMGQLMALKKPVNEPEPIKGIPEVFDYPRDIQPILDKHCIKCHDYDKRKGNVVLAGDRGPMFSHSYVTLTLRKQFVDGRNDAKSNLAPRSIGTSASPIMKKISGEHSKVKLSGHEQDMIRYWIESAAPYPGTYAALGCGSIGGYQQNKQIHKDDKWPTATAFKDVVNKRCADCHKKELNLTMPKSLSDENGISFWRPNWNDRRFKFSRHLMFNLTRPDKSLYLLAPLSKKAGGYGLCGKDEPVFANTSDPDYQALITHITAGKVYLEEDLTRFDMAQFKPRPGYLREMKRYGILPQSFDPAKDKFDVYELERRYWESLWHKPE